jgi:HK97 family phage major capsid protein
VQEHDPPSAGFLFSKGENNVASEMITAIEGIGRAFDEFKKTNDQRLEEERKGHEARAKELSETLDKIGEELTTQSKKKTELEKRFSMLSERTEMLEAMNDRPKATVQDKIRNEHTDLFLKWVRSGGTDQQVMQQYKELSQKAIEYKDVLIGTNLAGGFALPEQIARDVERLILKFSDIVANVKNVQVGTQDYKELVTIHGGNSAWAGETDTRNASNTPNLRERAPTWGELYAYPKASEHALQDVFFDVVNWITNDVAEGQAVELSTVILSGNGSNKPTGMTNTTPVTTDDYASPLRAAAAYEYIPISTPSSPQASAGITLDTLIDLTVLLRPGYRSGAKFAMNSLTLGHVRKKKDTTNQYIWQPSFQSGMPDTILGYPVFIWEEMGNATTGNAFPVAFGNFMRAYVLCTRAGLAITRDDVTQPGYSKFYVRRRYGGCPLNNDAVKFARVED